MSTATLYCIKNLPFSSNLSSHRKQQHIYSISLLYFFLWSVKRLLAFDCAKLCCRTINKWTSSLDKSAATGEVPPWKYESKNFVHGQSAIMIVLHYVATSKHGQQTWSEHAVFNKLCKKYIVWLQGDEREQWMECPVELKNWMHWSVRTVMSIYIGSTKHQTHKVRDYLMSSS